MATVSAHRQLWRLLKAAFHGWWSDNVPRMGASMAYYTLFALAPVLILVIAIGGALFGAEAVRGEVFGQIQGLVGSEGARTIQGMLEAATKSRPQLAVTIGAVITFTLGATGAFLELQGALDVIWRAKPKSRGSLLKDLLFQRLISVGLVLGFTFVLLTALVISAALAAISTYIGGRVPGAPILLKIADLGLSFGVIAVLFTLIFRVMPDTTVRWHDAAVGGVLTALLFTVGKFLIGLYLGASSVTSTYGAASSVIVILTWVYYVSQIVLVGAEFTKALGDRAQQEPRTTNGRPNDRSADHG